MMALLAATIVLFSAVLPVRFFSPGTGNRKWCRLQWRCPQGEEPAPMETESDHAANVDKAVEIIFRSPFPARNLNLGAILNTVMKYSAPKVSVVILNFNGRKYLENFFLRYWQVLTPIWKWSWRTMRPPTIPCFFLSHIIPRSGLLIM